jgi:hypothetical protein
MKNEGYIKMNMTDDNDIQMKKIYIFLFGILLLFLLVYINFIKHNSKIKISQNDILIQIKDNNVSLKNGYSIRYANDSNKAYEYNRGYIYYYGKCSQLQYMDIQDNNDKEDLRFFSLYNKQGEDFEYYGVASVGSCVETLTDGTTNFYISKNIKNVISYEEYKEKIIKIIKKVNSELEGEIKYKEDILKKEKEIIESWK